MRKIFVLFGTMLLLSGCAESVALLSGSVGGASSGKVLQSSFNTIASYGIKKQTGKGPLEHVISYAEKMNPEKKKEPCLSFVEKTNSEICLIVKKQLDLTKTKIISSSLKSNIEQKSHIKHLD
tara:strand:+ start:217 stop:585 length:369 start_codon:yes stop_codon:yes gene_type:complete